MRRYKIFQLTVGLLLTIVLFSAAGAQRASVKNQAPIKPKTVPQRQSTSSDDSWWAAQRSLEAAIQQLEKYLQQSPTGRHAPTARQQLAALRSLSITQLQAEWVPMRSLPLSDVPLWRVADVEQLSDRTRTVIEIKCGSEREDCSLKPFQKYVLLLLGAGELYPMLEAKPLPADIRYTRDGTALLSAGRTVSVIVDFAPLRPMVSGGQVQFRDANDAVPAKFSLIRKP
jgi:hypothetical protein